LLDEQVGELDRTPLIADRVDAGEVAERLTFLGYLQLLLGLFAGSPP